MTKEKREKVERAGQMYERGMNVTEIAQKLGCALSTASLYLKESGVKKNRTAELVQKITEMYAGGATISKIKKELGISNTFIMSVLKKKGLRKRIYFQSEIDLIDENTKFAEDRLANFTPEKMLVDGVMYEDVTPILSPR